MDKQKQLLESIQDVVKAMIARLNQQDEPLFASSKTHVIEASNILQSIKDLSTLVENLPPAIDEEIQRAIAHTQITSSIQSLSHLISQRKNLFEIPDIGSIPLLTMLGKDQNENFHSDYLSLIINTNKTGSYSAHFIQQLLSFVTGETIYLSGTFCRSEREKELVDFDVKGPSAKRRIDLFITAGDYLIIIENKINSFELEDQTKDYFEAVSGYYHQELTAGKKKLIPILLSPGKLKAMDPHYYSLSYVELAKIFLATPQDMLNQESKTFLNLYLKSIAHNFIEKEINYEKHLKEFWRKAA